MFKANKCLDSLLEMLNFLCSCSCIIFFYYNIIFWNICSYFYLSIFVISFMNVVILVMTGFTLLLLTFKFHTELNMIFLQYTYKIWYCIISISFAYGIINVNTLHIAFLAYLILLLKIYQDRFILLPPYFLALNKTPENQLNSMNQTNCPSLWINLLVGKSCNK